MASSANQYLNILLQKSDPLMEWGFDIIGGKDATSPLIISKINDGTFCSQYLSEGDVILQIDGIDAGTLLHAEALAFVKRPSKSLDLIVLKNGAATMIRRKYSAGSLGSGILADTESVTSGSNSSTLERTAEVRDDRRRKSIPRSSSSSKYDLQLGKAVTEGYSSSDESVQPLSSCMTNSMEVQITEKAGSWRYYPKSQQQQQQARSDDDNWWEDDPTVKHRCKETRNFWKELEAGSDGNNGDDKKPVTSFRDFNSEYLAYDKIQVYEKVEDYETGYCNVKAETGLEISGEFLTAVVNDCKDSCAKSVVAGNNLCLPKSYKEFQNKSSFQSLRTADEESNLSSLTSSVDTVSSSSSSSFSGTENGNCSSSASCATERYRKDDSEFGSSESSSSGYSSSEQRRKQTSVTSDNPYVPIANNGSCYSEYVNEPPSSNIQKTAPPPPPPPPPPSIGSGNIPSMRLKSEIPNRTEPPATIQNAMMTKDKKPFTYTPGGLDLSQIKSPLMQKRMVRNAQSPPDNVLPSPPPPPPNGIPASVAASMTPHLAVPVLPAQDLGAAIKNLNSRTASSYSTDHNVNDVKSPTVNTVPIAQLNKTSTPAWLQKQAVQTPDNTAPWANKNYGNNNNTNNVQKSPDASSPKFTSQSAPFYGNSSKTAENEKTDHNQSGARVIPIQIEGTEQQTAPNVNDQRQQNRWSNFNGNPSPSVPQNRIRPDNERTTVYSPEMVNNQPVQSRSFKVIQRITSGDKDSASVPYSDVGDVIYNNSEGVPLSQLRKMHLSDDDRSFMNKVKAQVDDEHYLHTETDPRYRGSAIPSRAFRMLQNMTDSGQVTRNTESPVVYNQKPVYSENRGYQSGEQNVYIPPSERQVDEDVRKYTGSSIPSRSFRILQAMTATEPTTEQTPAFRSVAETVVGNTNNGNEANPASQSSPILINPSSSLIIPTDIFPYPPRSPDETFLLWQHYKYLHALVIENYHILKFYAYKGDELYKMDCQYPGGGVVDDYPYSDDYDAYKNKATAFINLKVSSEDKTVKVGHLNCQPVENLNATPQSSVQPPDTVGSNILEIQDATAAAYETDINIIGDEIKEAICRESKIDIGNQCADFEKTAESSYSKTITEDDKNDFDDDEDSVSVTVSLPLRKKPKNEDNPPTEEVADVDFWSELSRDEDDLYYKPTIKTNENERSNLDYDNFSKDNSSLESYVSDDTLTDNSKQFDNTGADDDDDFSDDKSVIDSSSSSDSEQDEQDSVTEELTDNNLNESGTLSQTSCSGSSSIDTGNNASTELIKTDSSDQEETKCNKNFQLEYDNVSSSIESDRQQLNSSMINSPDRRIEHDDSARKAHLSQYKNEQPIESAYTSESAYETREEYQQQMPNSASYSRIISSYERAATHSRLFKLLQEFEDSPVIADNSIDNEQPVIKLRNSSSSSRRSNGGNNNNNGDKTDRKKVFSLPLGIDLFDYSSTTSSSGIDSPSNSSSSVGIAREKFAEELVNDLLSIDDCDLSEYAKERIKNVATRMMRDTADHSTTNFTNNNGRRNSRDYRNNNRYSASIVDDLLSARSADERRRSDYSRTIFSHFEDRIGGSGAAAAGGSDYSLFNRRPRCPRILSKRDLRRAFDFD